MSDKMLMEDWQKFLLEEDWDVGWGEQKPREDEEEDEELVDLDDPKVSGDITAAAATDWAKRQHWQKGAPWWKAWDQGHVRHLDDEEVRAKEVMRAANKMAKDLEKKWSKKEDQKFFDSLPEKSKWTKRDINRVLAWKRKQEKWVRNRLNIGRLADPDLAKDTAIELGKRFPKLAAKIFSSGLSDFIDPETVEEIVSGAADAHTANSVIDKATFRLNSMTPKEIARMKREYPVLDIFDIEDDLLEKVDNTLLDKFDDMWQIEVVNSYPDDQMLKDMEDLSSFIRRKMQEIKESQSFHDNWRNFLLVEEMK